MNLELIDIDNRKQCIEFYEFIQKYCSKAKGSSNNHQCWDGGYFGHLDDIFKYAIGLYELLSKDRELDFSLSDALLVLFLHDIEKPIKYSNLKGQFGKTDDEVKSILIDKFKFILTEQHLNAIKYVHGEGDDYRKDKRVMNSLAAFCHCCDVISARIFFNYP
jgi:hypothetical protein